MISAKLICDSITPAGNRLSTFVLTYPRFIHSEFMTHRCFSRNASSSRAIPLAKTMKDVRETPAMPEFWGANQKGMQAATQLEGGKRFAAIGTWGNAVRDAVFHASWLETQGVHKQIANRVLEPFSHITVVATSAETGLRNFFALRAHKDAQPEFQVLAYRMLDLWLKSEPDRLSFGEWHMPFSQGIEEKVFSEEDWLKICTGRIARVSYLTHDGVRDPQADIELHDRLKESGHWSPFEHCAQARLCDDSNFGKNWKQYRNIFNTAVSSPNDFELSVRLQQRPDWFAL